MLHRRVVAITPVRCFLIPRYWLLEQNRANIWGRVKLFMDSKYPTKEQLFDEFVRNRKYIDRSRIETSTARDNVLRSPSELPTTH